MNPCSCSAGKTDVTPKERTRYSSAKSAMNLPVFLASSLSSLKCNGLFAREIFAGKLMRYTPCKIIYITLWLFMGKAIKTSGFVWKSAGLR
jgi:hypothetical protein